VIAEPPVFVGTVQLRLICDDETAVAVSPAGNDGILVALDVVIEDVLEGELAPTELIAETR